MNRKRLFLILALGIALVLLCASAALADNPVGVSMELSSYTFTGPQTVDVTIRVTNNGDGDMPAPVTLYYPDGSKVTEFGSPTLKVGSSKRWNGQWTVTQEELDAGKVTFSVRYSLYDGPDGEDGEPTLKKHKMSFSKSITYKENTQESTTETTYGEGAAEPTAAPAAKGDSPIKVSMELSSYKFKGPQTIDVSITVTNVGEGDLPGPVTLYYPNGEKVEDFGSPTLSVGSSKHWTGEWKVTQTELDAGKVTFSVRYSAYDGDIGEDGEPSLKNHKVNFSKKITYLGADPEITVNRTITPTTAQKGQEVSVVYEIVNTGSVDVTSVNIKENASISSKSGTIDAVAAGQTGTYTFTAVMGSKDLTSAATVSYKAGGKTFTTKVESATIKYGEVKLTATLKADKKGGAPGEILKLTLTLKNSGNLDFTNVTVTDPTLGTVFSGETVKAGETKTLEKELTITESMDLQFTVKADESTGNGVETATGRVSVIAMDPTKQIVLSLEAEADREMVYKIPGTVRFKVTVHNNSNVDVKNVTVKAVDVTLYTFENIPAGTNASFIRDTDVNIIGNKGTFQFTATCKDALDQVLTFVSNPVVIMYSEPTPEPTEAPLVTPPAPAKEPMPTRQPEPEWLSQAETAADGAKWILAAVAGLLLVLLLIGAVRRGKRRSESRKAMDHLEGATYRDYSAEPKRRRRSEISNGGTADAAADEPKTPEEDTAQSSELMAETLRKLYADKPEEKAEETAAGTAETTGEAAAETAQEGGENAGKAESEAKDAEEAAGGRRRRSRKSE